MERILIFIKHRLHFLWKLIERANGFIFTLFFRNKLSNTAGVVIREIQGDSFSFRELNNSDIDSLHTLLTSQPQDDLRYFNPHGFDRHSLECQMNNRAFLMMGAFDKDKLIGYFFLRFFANRKCFVGRLIDKNYRGKGVGRTMNRIMYGIAWQMNFRCLSTVSTNNQSVMKAHAGNTSMKILKKLDNDYLLVEFVRNAEATSDYPINCNSYLHSDTL